MLVYTIFHAAVTQPYTHTASPPAIYMVKDYSLYGPGIIFIAYVQFSLYSILIRKLRRFLSNHMNT